MKKFFLLLFIAALTIPVFAGGNNETHPPSPPPPPQPPQQVQPDEGLVLNFNIGNIGLGGLFPLGDTSSYLNLDMHLSLANVGIESRSNNLGIGFSPLVVTSLLYDEFMFDGFLMASLLNVNMYWNFLNLYMKGGGNFYLGPFASVNYIFFDENFHWDKYIFTAGFHMGLRANFGRVGYNIFSIEAGYRNINGTSNYYVGGKIDLVTLFLTSLLVSVATF